MNSRYVMHVCKLAWPTMPSIITTRDSEHAPGRRTQAERRAESRSALLTATLEILAERGYAGLSIAEVCERAGRSVGAHLHHFGTKSVLVTAAIDHLAELRIQAMRDDLAATPRIGIAAALDVAWHFYTGPTFIVALELWVAARTDTALRDHLLPVEAKIDREVMSLAEQIAPGQVSVESAAVAVASMRGLAMRRFLEPGVDLDKDWQAFRAQLIAMICSERGMVCCGPRQ